MIKPYRICCAQTNIRYLNHPSERDEVLGVNLSRALEISREAVLREGARVIVFPDFFLQGFEYDRSVEDWIKACIRIPGPETDRMAEEAVKLSAYLVGCALEYDPEWPNLYFNTAFIVSPEGEVILRYRKLDSGWNLTYTTPGDIYSAYVQRYGGPEALFPVVDTPIGRLGCLICYDVNFFEVSRCLVWRGAEVLFHPTGEPHGGHRAGWEQARRTRAYENIVYFATANQGSVTGSRFPNFRSRGHSELIDYEGRVLAVADAVGEALISATVDIEALRYRRSQVRMNFPAQLKAQMFAPIYRAAAGYPNDSFLAKPMLNRREGRDIAVETIKRYQQTGRYVESELYQEQVPVEVGAIPDD
jgi:predicted amidohydrolase